MQDGRPNWGWCRGIGSRWAISSNSRHRSSGSHPRPTRAPGNARRQFAMWIFRKLFGPVQRFLERRRFPTLFLILAALFGANLFVPDPIPFIAELIMLV